MKKILVTGAAGFIGSHTVDLLLQKGMRVTAYDNLSSGKISNLDLFNPNLEFIQGDISDYAALSTQIKRCDAVLHLAALPSVPKSIEDPISSLRVNTQGFLHILQAVREASHTIRVVYASSASVYGDTSQLPCDDETPLSTIALSPYALEKMTNEAYAALYQKLFGITSLGLRYFNVYGSRQDPSSPYSGVISKFISAYEKNEDIVVLGDGKQSRDFISVRDVARANWLALQSVLSGILNIATGAPESLMSLISCIESSGKRKAQVMHASGRTGDIKESYAKIDKAKRELEFTAEITLADGIKDLMANRMPAKSTLVRDKI